jgi:hypothetical protein
MCVAAAVAWGQRSFFSPRLNTAQTPVLVRANIRSWAATTSTIFDRFRRNGSFSRHSFSSCVSNSACRGEALVYGRKGRMVSLTSTYGLFSPYCPPQLAHPCALHAWLRQLRHTGTPAGCFATHIQLHVQEALGMAEFAQLCSPATLPAGELLHDVGFSCSPFSHIWGVIFRSWPPSLGSNALPGLA